MNVEEVKVRVWMHANSKSWSSNYLKCTCIKLVRVFIKICEYLQLITNYHTIVGKFKYLMNLPKLWYCVRQLNIDKCSQIIALFLWETWFWYCFISDFIVSSTSIWIWIWLLVFVTKLTSHWRCNRIHFKRRLFKVGS